MDAQPHGVEVEHERPPALQKAMPRLQGRQKPPRKRARGTTSTPNWQQLWLSGLPRLQPGSWINGLCSACEQPGGPDLITCMGPCLRAFHASCIGVKVPADEEGCATWMCPECKSGVVRCCICGEFGAGRPDCASPLLQPVRKCLQGACGRFMHMTCAREHQLTHLKPNGKSGYCPHHYCALCCKSGDGLDMVKCVRCTVAYHIGCSPAGVRRYKRMNRVMVCEHCCDTPAGPYQRPPAPDAGVAPSSSSDMPGSQAGSQTGGTYGLALPSNMAAVHDTSAGAMLPPPPVAPRTQSSGLGAPGLLPSAFLADASGGFSSPFSSSKAWDAADECVMRSRSYSSTSSSFTASSNLSASSQLPSWAMDLGRAGSVAVQQGWQAGASAGPDRACSMQRVTTGSLAAVPTDCFASAAAAAAAEAAATASCQLSGGVPAPAAVAASIGPGPLQGGAVPATPAFVAASASPMCTLSHALAGCSDTTGAVAATTVPQCLSKPVLCAAAMAQPNGAGAELPSLEGEAAVLPPVSPPPGSPDAGLATVLSSLLKGVVLATQNITHMVGTEPANAATAEAAAGAAGGATPASTEPAVAPPQLGGAGSSGPVHCNSLLASLQSLGSLLLASMVQGVTAPDGSSLTSSDSEDSHASGGRNGAASSEQPGELGGLALGALPSLDSPLPAVPAQQPPSAAAAFAALDLDQLLGPIDASLDLEHLLSDISSGEAGACGGASPCMTAVAQRGP